MRSFTLWRQTLSVFFLIGIHQVLILLIQGMLGQVNQWRFFLLPAVTSTLLWPWLVYLLQETKLAKRRFN